MLQLPAAAPCRPGLGKGGFLPVGVGQDVVEGFQGARALREVLGATMHAAL